MARFKPYYPSTRFHASKGWIIVKNLEEDEKLGEDWSDTPEGARAYKPKSEPKPSWSGFAKALEPKAKKPE